MDRTGQAARPIKVFGIGGGGCNAVNAIALDALDGAELIAVCADEPALEANRASRKIRLSTPATTGPDDRRTPAMMMDSAIAARDDIEDALNGADTVFIVAGLGGATGTGGAPVVAELSRMAGARTVAVVTMPFQFEGRRRHAEAKRGVLVLKELVDTLIVVPNQFILAAARGGSLADSFGIADELLRKAVLGRVAEYR